MLKRPALRLWLLVLPLLLFTAGAAAADTLIVALGASSTAGKGVAPAETYPAQLESMLNAKGMHVRGTRPTRAALRDDGLTADLMGLRLA